MKKLNKRGFLSLLNLIIILAILSLISACGGGGGVMTQQISPEYTA